MLRAPADAGDGRVDHGVRKVELGLAHAGIRLLQGRLAELPRRGRVVEFLAADRALVDQGLEPRFLATSLIDLRGCGRELPFCLRQRDLERRAIDLEQRRAFLDRVAFVVELLLQNARHAGAHLDLPRAFDLSRNVEANRHASGLDLDDVNRNRLRRGSVRRALLAASSNEHHGNDQRNLNQR